MARRVPRLTTDAEAEAFLAQDLSDLDFSLLEPVRFAFERESERINLRVPRPMPNAGKARGRQRGIPYTRLVRDELECEVAAGETGWSMKPLI